MNDSDHALGMGREISRRDFVNGVAVAVGSLALPLSAHSQGNSTPASGAVSVKAAAGPTGSWPRTIRQPPCRDRPRRICSSIDLRPLPERCRRSNLFGERGELAA